MGRAAKARDTVRKMHLRTAFFTTTTVLSCLALLGLLAGCGGGGSSSPSSNVIHLDGSYSTVDVTSPINLADPYPIPVGLNNVGQVALGTEPGGAARMKAANPRLVHLYPPTAPYTLWQIPDTLAQLPAGYDYGQMNDSGVIVAVSTAGVAGTYSAGTVTLLPIPSGFTQTLAQVINNPGDVAGVASSNSTEQAFLWKGGAATSLGLPAGITEVTCTGIDNSDQIIGQYKDSQGAVHSFLWDAGVLTDLGGFAATAINNSGEITGATAQFQPAVWIAGKVTVLPMPNPAIYGTEFAIPNAINDSGEIVGDVVTTKASFPALWRNGKLYNLTDAPSTSKSSPLTLYDVYGIDNSGRILAAASASTGGLVVLLMPVATDPAVGTR